MLSGPAHGAAEQGNLQRNTHDIQNAQSMQNAVSKYLKQLTGTLLHPSILHPTALTTAAHVWVQA